MQNVTLDVIYDELISLKREVRKLETILVCEEKIPEDERVRLQTELDAALKEEWTNFRDVKRK